ncbi:uncharacterized protein ACIQIH_010945 [Cyanocitta cristata]
MSPGTRRASARRDSSSTPPPARRRPRIKRQRAVTKRPAALWQPRYGAFVSAGPGLTLRVTGPPAPQPSSAPAPAGSGPAPGTAPPSAPPARAAPPLPAALVLIFPARGRSMAERPTGTGRVPRTARSGAEPERCLSSAGALRTGASGAAGPSQARGKRQGARCATLGTICRDRQAG